jgi:glycosyltransferase involved in cell wall biosynthesis
MKGRPTTRLLFVVGRGRLDPATHKRVYDLLEPLARLGYGADVFSLDSELLWTLRERARCGARGYGRLFWFLNATRLLPLLIRARAYLARRRFARLARASEVVVVNQRFLNDDYRRLLTANARRIAYELDDAVWLQDEAMAAQMMNLADVVVAGNEFLASYARRIHPHVRVIPTGVRLDRYERAARRQRTDRRVTIGWIGSPSTVRYLERLVEPLAELGRWRPVALEVVGCGSAGLPAFRGVEVRSFPRVPYDPADYVPGFDVGVMPLDDGEFERGKCGAKALEYMAAGVPAVCSPVGENVRVVEHGVSGLLAGPSAEWVEALDRLAGDPDLRRRMGAAGRERVAKYYSADLVAGLWDDAIREICLPVDRPLRASSGVEGTDSV